MQIKAEGLAAETHSSLGAGTCQQGPQLPPRSPSWVPGAGHRHLNLTLSTSKPSHLRPVPVQPAFPLRPRRKHQSASGQAEVCKGERETGNK